MEPHCGVEGLGAGEGSLKSYLVHRMYRRKAPPGGHSDDLSHQVSPQEMRVQLVKLEVRAPDPALGQEPGHRGIRGQEKRWGWGPLVWQLELEQGQEWGEGRAEGQCTADSRAPCMFKCFPLSPKSLSVLCLTPATPLLPGSSHLDDHG